MERLIPSRETVRIINNYKPLSQELLIKWVTDYQNKKSSKAALVLINAVSKMFASQIKRNLNKFINALPLATYDDIFNQMVLLFLQGLSSYNPTKSRLTTWTFYTIMPITKNPYQVMGNKFAGLHKPTNIDKPVGDSDMTIGELIPDKNGSPLDLYYLGKNKNKVLRAIKKLKPRDQLVVLNLFGFVPPKKEWQSKTGKINATSIARGLGISADRMWRRIDKIYATLRSLLSLTKMSKHQKIKQIDRLIEKLKS